MGTIAAHGEPSGINGFDGADGIAFNARDLDETTDGVTGETEIMFHGNFSGIFNLLIRAAHGSDKPGGSHGASYPHLSLTTYLGAGDGSIRAI